MRSGKSSAGEFMQACSSALDKSHQPSGRRWSRAFPLPAPFFPFWAGRPASGQSVQHCPRWLHERLREPKMTSKIAQDGFQDAPRCPKTAPRRLLVATEPPKDASERPKSCQNQMKKKTCVLPSGLFASDGLPRPQDGSTMAQESSKRCPRGPQDGPKSAPRSPQEGPKRLI